MNFGRSWKIVFATTIAVLAIASGGAALLINETRVSPGAIQSSVIRADDAIERAWNTPVAASFQRKIAWQSNASLCGPASLANIFRSLGDPATTEQQVLTGTGLCRTGYCIIGLTLDELAALARSKTQRTVTVIRDISADEFREHLKLSNSPDRRYLINFTRRTVFGAGAGHHSPIGGYLEAEDLVFVLDVNRAYQPWLVERARLFDAMNTRDGDKTRGLLLIQ
jgi:hypothetical protein